MGYLKRIITILLLLVTAGCGESGKPSSQEVRERNLKSVAIGECSGMTTLFQVEGSTCKTSGGFEFTRVEVRQSGQLGWKDNVSNLIWLDGMIDESVSSYEDNVEFCQKRGARIPTQEEIHDLALRNFNEVFGYKDVLDGWNVSSKQGFWTSQFLWTSTADPNNKLSHWVYTVPRSDKRSIDVNKVAAATMSIVSGDNESLAGPPHTPIRYSSTKAICVN